MSGPCTTGESYRSRLLALTDMPKGETGLNVDFGSFIGPLFFVWLVQLPLPWVRLWLFVFQQLLGVRQGVNQSS